MDPRQTLAELARQRGTSLSALSRMIGRNTSYLQQYITKGSPRKLEEEDRRHLARFFGVEEAALSELEGKSYIPSAAPKLRDAPRLRDAPMSNDDWVEVPRLALEASAGPGAVGAALGGQEIRFDAFQFSRRWLREQGLEPGHLSAIRVMGDSMEPLLRDGDEILVDRAQRPFREGVHVLRLGDVLHVKRVQAGQPGRMLLISANPAYEPLDVAMDDVELIGRVVWKSGRL